MSSIAGRWTGGGPPPAWVAAALVVAGFVAAASVLLAYWVSPVAVVGLPLVPLAVWTILRFRVGALVLLLLCLPLGRLTLAELGPVPVSPVTVLVAVLMVAWLWRVLIGSERIELSHMQLPLALFLLCGTISIYAAPDAGKALKVLFIFAMGAAVYLVASQTVRSEEEARGVLWAVACAVGAIGLYAVVAGAEGGVAPETQAFPGVPGAESYDRVEGIFSSANGMGGFLALAIPPIVALAVSENLWWRRVAGYLLVAAAMAGLALTYSRGAWLGTGAGLLVLLPVLRRGGAWLVLGLVLTGASAAAGGALDRLRSVTEAGSDTAVTSRFDIWEAALGLVSNHPLLGVGLGNFQAAYGDLLVPGLPLLPYFFGVPEEAHNLFLNLAVEVGLVGAGAFAWLLAVALLQTWRTSRSADRQVRAWSLGLGAGLVAILVHTLVDVIVYQGLAAILLFTYLGLIDAMRRFAVTEQDRAPSMAQARTTGTAGTGGGTAGLAVRGRPPQHRGA